MRRIVTFALLCATFFGSAAHAQINQNLPAGAATVPGVTTVDTTQAMQAQAVAARAARAQPPEGVAQSPLAPMPEYGASLTSDVFGANLFTGSFARGGATQFNPDYLIAVGDRVQVRLWGGYTFDEALVVDPQGNVFLPHVGPIRVMGAANKDLQRVVDAGVRRVFRANVYSYASLAAAQPVRIFVGGFVHRPGLYNGTSMDSLLHYLDQAGGIDAERGSFLAVQVKRGEQVRATLSLYDFLLEGRMPLLQLSDGDVIFVPPRNNAVAVRGLVQNAKRFEFTPPEVTIAYLAHLGRPKADATHVRVTRNTGTVRNAEYYPIEQASSIYVANGDEVEFTADKKPGTITVRVEGEHVSPQEYVLPYGARMGELVGRIQVTPNAETESIQLYRRSVKERQQVMLQTALKSLETSVLTARSGTSDEARLRKEEAELILQWVDRARKIETSGQVLIAQTEHRHQLLLENGDIIRIPTRDGLVLVSGEVLFPNAIAYRDDMSLEEYIQSAGGYTQNADNSRIIVAHRDGSFTEGDEDMELRAGDQVMVLPKIDVKSRQIWKDLTQIIYQIAVGAKIVFDL
jgi:protein involved in polysaccharide export with SLBB domain